MSNYSVRLCPKVNEHGIITKSSVASKTAVQELREFYDSVCGPNSIGNFPSDICKQIESFLDASSKIREKPSINSIIVPLQSITCDTESIGKGTWEIPLVPVGCNPFKDGEMQTIHWEQEVNGSYTAWGPSTKTTEYWIFKCSVPQGHSEYGCPECFHGHSFVWLLGNLGFNGGFSQVIGGEVYWRIHRRDLPMPGESLIAVTVIPGEGDMLAACGQCAPPKCDTPDGDCVYGSLSFWGGGRRYRIQTSGSYWVIGSTFFATPTWTGGKLIDYYTDSLGWAGLGENTLAFPVCDVYGDESLKYLVQVEGTIKQVTSSDFAGYGIGTHVLLKKLGKKHSEPFSDSCLGVDEDSPAEVTSCEEIGTSDGTFSPELSNISRTPIDVNSIFEVKTSYDIITNQGWITKEMKVNVDENGNCSGNCSAGKINMKTGVWITDIVWQNIPNSDKKEGSVITIVCRYTKTSESGGDIVILPWHVMGMGG